MFSKKKLGGNIKSSYLALIQKEANPSTFNKFHPISLCNSSYKIITKIIANRVKEVFPIIISENQGGFVPNRKIIDNVIIVQKAVHSNMLRQEKGLIIKLDMANAFNKVSQSYLMVVLQKLGFSREIVEDIHASISTPWIAPLINGRTSDFFQSTRGPRQGCPLSPFLNIIMAETLSSALKNQRKERNITGIKIAKGVKTITHSLFADETVLLGGASTIIARRLKKILDDFL